MQVEFIEDLYEYLSALYASTTHKPELTERFPHPSFKVVVLYIDEATSINRQLARQAKSETHNKKVRDARAGTFLCAPLPTCFRFASLALPLRPAPSVATLRDVRLRSCEVRQGWDAGRRGRRTSRWRSAAAGTRCSGSTTPRSRASAA